MKVLTKKSKYAIRALLALAKRHGQDPVLIAELAAQERIPKKFLELILLELKNNGILRSKKGKGGGYLLARDPEEISVGEVIQALDGPFAPLPCVSRTGHRTCEECEDEATCGLRAVMNGVQDASAAILDNTSVVDLLRRTAALEQEKNKVLVYAI